MLKKLVLFLAIAGINGEPETVRENFDYFSDGTEDYLDQHMVRLM